MSAARCKNCGKCGLCSPRMIRVPHDEVLTMSNSRAEQEQEVRENAILEKLARAIMEEKIRPEIIHEEIVAALAQWLHGMLIGPAIPLNKEKNFFDDILLSIELITDAEIFVETLPGCDKSLIRRNRADETKRHIYPDPNSPLRVRAEILRNKCTIMVNHFANQKNVSKEELRERAVDLFCNFYLEAITEKHPSSYNSYTGMMAVMDSSFLKRSEDCVMYGLGLMTEPPKDTTKLRNAYPPIHTLLTFTTTMTLCIFLLPSLHSIDEYATIEVFTSSIFKQGLLKLSPLTLGCIRLSFSFICIVVTAAKIKKGSQFKIVLLPGSKLHGGCVEMKGWKTQGFYTSWAWNLLGLSFFLGGMIPILVANGRDDIFLVHPWILRAALISFEISSPSAFLTSSVVTYALWPQAYKTHGASGTVGFKGWINLLQHNGNSAMVLLEIMVMGGLPVVLSHAAFAPLFAGVYQAFLWLMANRWSPNHGPVFPYYFTDTTLGNRTTIFMLALLTTIGCFFALFALLDMGMSLIGQGDNGVIPNLSFVVWSSYLLMKFKD